MNTALCAKCKGRGYCGKPCPFLSYYKNVELKKDFLSETPPSIFVGRFNYPNVNIGVLSPPEETKNVEYFDNHYAWFKERKSLNEIAGLRAQLINSRIRGSVKKQNKIIETFQEITLGKKSVDLEIHLKKQPKPIMNTFTTSTMIGPHAELEKVRLAENVKVDKRIEKAYYDTDLKSVKAINELYKKGVNESKLARVLSAGILGVKINRKLVPTRWSITAVDDNLGKNLIKQIKYNKQIDEYHVYYSSRMGNAFCVILMPGQWTYELFECVQTNELQYTTNYETYYGRKEYAKETAGGYYASRLGVLEQLVKKKRQASALIIREITKDYYLPIGVWQVRENVRNSFNKVIKFGDWELVKQYVTRLFSFNINEILVKSKLLKERKQPKLTNYF
ncbi:MAG: hypothetical protein GON13_03460 [Nanoarchaeota archaeon]|nr:hypothetical protein [Nanoarchaeota archaeon]